MHFIYYSFKCLLILLLLFSSFPAFPQSKAIDSLRNELKHPKNDTLRIDILYNLAQETFVYDSSKAIRYLDEGFSYAKKMDFFIQVANYYQIKAKLYNDWGGLVLPWLDSAIHYYRKSLIQKQRASYLKKAQLSIATCNGSKGGVLKQLGKPQEAIAAYIGAMQAWKASDEERKYEAVATYCNNIAGVYYDLKDGQKALQWDKESITYRLLDGNEEFLARSYFKISDDFFLLSDLDSAFAYLQKPKYIVEKLSKHPLNYSYFNRCNNLFRAKKQYRQAIEFGERALNEAKTTGNPLSIANASRELALSFIETNEYDKARTYLLTALKIQEENNYVSQQLTTFEELVDLEEKTAHYEQAYKYLKKLKTIEDSVKTNEAKTAIAEIENKYQVAEKEKSIIQLQKDKEVQAFSIRNKSILNYALIGSVFILLVIIFLTYRNFRNRQMLSKKNEELQQQRIRELEKDKQLVAVDSMLKGQEEERNRLAKDLHDGLGGMLSGVKFSLMNMKNNLIIDHENVMLFERSLDMLDTSIQELRRVAHNMMPEALVKFGLDEALKDYFNMVNNAKIVNVQYQSFGMEKRLDSTTEIIIYRIIQELFNNIFKHAKATEVLVQLLREGNRLTVTVEDNGKGFDTNDLATSKGAGWANIKSRVDYLKGKVDLDSEAGKGTSVNIELNVT
jgi:two-component system, NarL family, sensor kinase